FIQVQYLLSHITLKVVVLPDKIRISTHAEHVIKFACGKFSVKIWCLEVEGPKVKNKVLTFSSDLPHADRTVSKTAVKLLSRIASEQTYFIDLSFCWS